MIFSVLRSKKDSFIIIYRAFDNQYLTMRKSSGKWIFDDKIATKQDITTNYINIT